LREIGKGERGRGLKELFGAWLRLCGSEKGRGFVWPWSVPHSPYLSNGGGKT